ncbi:MAG: hypothetical protein ACYDC6_12425 [Acidobacteriaceae bacterium]
MRGKMQEKTVQGARLRWDDGAVMGPEIAAVEAAADEFPEMPTRPCSDCKRQKKLMFFSSPKATYCRECAKARNRALAVGNPVPADLEYRMDAKIARERAR